jgi:phage tail sheath protein FI
MVPPSGHVAGVWARNDNTRGVHKAPANEVVRGAIGLAYSVTKGEQDTLNPNGVNCIRSFPGMGIRVWGARTLSSNPAWRYINVRRLFNFVEKSIERGTQWVVFEPNDPRLWSSVRRDVTAFLTGVWRDGALFGLSPSEAFFVKCDDETNPADVRDRGQMIVEIGMAPVKPAEFVIFRISQWGGPGSE